LAGILAPAGSDTRTLSQGLRGNEDGPDGPPTPGDGFRRRVSSLSVEVLLWAVGLFCGFVGAFLLVAPHHFQTAPYATLLRFAITWGTLALASGVGLLSVAVLRPPRAIGFAVHLLAGLTLMALAASFAAVGGTAGCFTYSILGLGTIAAGLLPRPPSAVQEGDLFALLLALSAIVAGFLFALFPQLLRNSWYGAFRSYLPLLGLLLALAGLLLAAAQLAPGLERRRRLVHLFSGSTFVVFGLLTAVPPRVWTGIILYCGGGLAIAFLPGLRRGLAALDTAALRTRLSLALAIATSLALILSTAVVTAQEEQLAKEQAGETEQIEAKSVAQNVFDYVDVIAGRTAILATFIGKAAKTPEGQQDVLATARKLYPDLIALLTIAADGRVLAVSGESPLPLREATGLAAATGRQPAGNHLLPVSSGGRSLLLFGAPLHGGNQPAGALIAAFDTAALARRIGRRGSAATVADGHGQTIVSVDRVQPGERPSRLPAGWDRTIRAGGRIEGREEVAGFAAVPKLDWAVAVERPRADALAGVRRGRDLAFGLLLLVIPLTVLAGIYASRRIARPLGDLSAAVDELTAGNLAVVIGASSNITEVARLSAAFQEMRYRLAERTGESERLAGELRARAEALAETDRRKDEFLAMLAHELRNPLGAIANASYLMEQLQPSPQMEKPVAIVRRQVQHLVRMVDDLLDVSRITRGKVELRRERLDLGKVLRQAVETALPLAGTKEQTLLADLPAEPLPLDGDATRLEQVFSNLLRNALKFTGTGGHVLVWARRDGGGEAVVRVRDDGIGIPVDLLPRIFDLFAQGEQGLDRAGAGLGIGLTLVRSLVEMHGGRVVARSEGLSRGSELEVRLPLAP
jgi:signal transduction histidine kinase